MMITRTKKSRYGRRRRRYMPCTGYTKFYGRIIFLFIDNLIILSIIQHKVSIWIWCLRVYVLKIMFCSFFFFFWFQPHYLTKSTVNSTQVYCLWVPQISLFSHFFIKNWSHGTIHTFKNYFVTMFSVLVKINSIQTDPILHPLNDITFEFAFSN